MKKWESVLNALSKCMNKKERKHSRISKEKEKELQAIKAYKILCDAYDENVVVTMCRDYEDFYVFSVRPEGSDPAARIYTGLFVTCVGKNDGKVFMLERYDLPDEYEYINPKVFQNVQR